MLCISRTLKIGGIWIILLATTSAWAVDTLDVRSETNGPWTTFDTELSTTRLLARKGPCRTRDGSLWWGLGIERIDLWGLLSEEGGVIRFDGTTWTRYTPSDGLMNGGVLAIVQSADGTLWFAGRHNRKAAVTRYDGASWTIYSEDDGLIGNWIGRSATVDTRGHIWLVTEKTALKDSTRGGYGVLRFDGKNWQNLSVTDGLAHNRVYDVTAGPDGSVWIATLQGVSCYNGTDWITYTSEDGLGGDGKVYRILVARDGKVWCTHGEKIGVSVFDGKTWKSIKEKDGLPINMVRDICETSDGTLWFGTYQNTRGLVCYRNGAWLRFTSKVGLPNDNVFNIAQGPDGALWLTSPRIEIIRYQPDFGSLWTVEGTVKQTDGSPRSNVGIQIRDETGQIRAGAVTDERGTYRLSIFPESYQVSLIDHRPLKSGFVFSRAIPIVGSALIAWIYFTVVWKILARRHPNRASSFQI